MRFQMLRRDIRLFLRCLVPAVVLTAVFAAVCAAAALAAVRGAEEGYTPVKAAVVDGEDSVFSRMLIRAVANTDYIADLMDLSLYDREDAMDGLRSGELAAVIILPDGLLDGITSGAETRGTIYLSPAAASHSDLVAGAASFGELLLASGQYGVFAGERLIWRHALGSDFHATFLTEANTLLLREAMGANSGYFHVVVTDYGDTSMSSEAYYAVSWLALLLMLSTLFFAPLYAADMNRPVLCRLRSAGVGDGQFLLGKLLFPAAFQMLLLCAVLAALGRKIPPTLRLGAVAAALAGVLLSAAIGGVLLMLGHRGTPLVVAAALGGLLLGGGILPRQMLPDALLTLGSITPYGVVQNFLRPLWGGRAEWLPSVMGAVYFLAAPMAARARLRYVRVKGGEA